MLKLVNKGGISLTDEHLVVAEGRREVHQQAETGSCCVVMHYP